MQVAALLTVWVVLPGQINPLAYVGSLAEELRSPARIAVAIDGTVFVTDPYRYQIVRYDTAGNLLGTWSVPDCPVGVAVHPDGRYFVSYRDEPGVGVYDATFTRTGLLGEGNPLVTFVRPTDIDIAADTGRIYVVDSGGDRVYAFEGDGTLALIFGERGESLAQFQYPSALAVDEVNGRLIVADQDNFRVQVFTTTGVFSFRFGYRNKYLVTGGEEGWMPRSQGVAVDASGYMYVADALMSTVRVFDPVGVDLGMVVEYGQGAGALRTPCDIALSPDGERLYVVSTNTSSVEIYAAPDLAGAASTAVAVRGAAFNPTGTNRSALDVAYRRGGPMPASIPLGKRGLFRRHAEDLRPPDHPEGAASANTASPSSYEGPHMIDATIICGRCHGIVDQPGGHPGTVEGQAALCFSCHSSGGQAMNMPLSELDMAGGSGGDPGRSHAWGVPAINEALGSTGPQPGGEMERYVDGSGHIKCSTCHDQHSNDVGAPYMRVSNASGALCKECHTTHIDHTPSGAWVPVCNECHKTHDPASVNLSLVATSITNQTIGANKPVVFTARTGANSFDDGDPAVNDGVCQVCHTATHYHLHDGTGTPHNDGADCTSCHPHSAGFMPAGGASCIACHSSPQDNGDNVPPGGRYAVVNADGTGGHHLAGGVLTDADCVTCHEMSLHQQGTVRLWTDPNNPTTPLPLTGDPNELVPFCSNCHDSLTHPIVHTTGAAWEPVCTQCHELHDPANGNLSLVNDLVRNETLSVDKPVVFTSRTGANSFDDGDPAVNNGICQVCHTATAYHREDGTGTAHNNGTDCTTCHPHPDGFIPSGGTSCIACHSGPQGPRPKVVNADGTGGHHLAGGVLTDGDCVTCHEMSLHQQGTVRLWTDPNNPTTPLPLTGDPNELVPFCSNCHDSLTHPIVHTTGAAWEPVCTQCHELHDPVNANLSLVNDVVRNETLGQDKPVVFTSRTGANSFDDGDPAVNDGICQVCHTATAYHREDGTGTAHNNGTDCTTCHPHQSGFLPTNASCQDCHAVPQGTRRSVIGEFGLASHHLQSVLLDDADCEVCHDMSQHQGGSVRLKDVDDPTNPGAVTVITGNPATDPAEAVKLEPFCLACHDSDGAAGDTSPFSDGQLVSIVDPALWTAGSHRVGAMTCFGDGQTFGCHDTGHGSNKRTLLAPSAVSPTPPGNVEEEEGFCYTCHDATGPASTDIESLFALSTHHNVSFADQADGSKVECTDCHDPHTASSTALLVDPDTGDAWTTGGPGFCLACHDGAPPSGVSFPPGSPGTGYDKSAFVGTTHATQLGGNTCRHCHYDHGSAYASLLRDQYIVTDYNQYTSGDGDYAACWICHDEDATVNQENAFKNRHDKHVKGEDSPCIICHDVHAGFDTGEPGLINFAYSVQAGYDIQFIDGRDGSTAFWINGAQDKGNCYLTCHNKRHDSKDYDRLPNPTVDCSVCHAP